jgi:hypothetical protein
MAASQHQLQNRLIDQIVDLHKSSESATNFDLDDSGKATMKPCDGFMVSSVTIQ